MPVLSPYLTATSGPLAGRKFPLPEGEWSIGRSAENSLWLPDREVSRRHCTITTTPDQCELRDLESHNHTIVNGKPVHSTTLRPGDSIQIGGSLFVFRTGEEPAGSTGAATLSTAQLRVEDSIFGISSDPGALLPARTQRDLRTLLRLSALLHSFRNLRGAEGKAARQSMRELLGNLILGLISADRAAVLIPGADELAPLARQAGSGKIALLSNGRTGAEPSVLAAPILTRDEVVAVIHLEREGGRLAFDEGDLQFVTAVAEMAAVAWENAAILDWLQDENERLRTDLELHHDMVGESPRLLELQRQITKVAASNASVLIRGESGTGKELVARAIHRSSVRANGPFVAINCAALTETLLESELFGHERGAFTGAAGQKRGKLEMAENGTVFLDEVGEMQPVLQAKLLRVLQQREMQRVGGTQTIRLNIRVVAATNRDLEEAVRKGAFREDLYYRLNVVALKTPSLRERPGDIIRLAEHFARKTAAECGRRLIGFAPEARAYLENYSWPGNIRELQNAIESAVVLGSTETILAEDLPEHVRSVRPPEMAANLFADSVETAKREVILRAFAQADNNHEAAARILGLHPNYLYKLLKTMNLKTSIRG